MAEVFDLGEQRALKAARQAFGLWKNRLGYEPKPGETLADLPDPVLAALAELEHRAVLALYDLVLGVRVWGRGEDLDALPAVRKMEALDVYLFLADQVRYEMMRRLGWIEGVAGSKHSLLEMATDHLSVLAAGQPGPPRLLPAHHRYQELLPRLKIEPEAAIRSLIPEALAVFRRKLGSV